MPHLVGPSASMDILDCSPERFDCFWGKYCVWGPLKACWINIMFITWVRIPHLQIFWAVILMWSSPFEHLLETFLQIIETCPDFTKFDTNINASCGRDQDFNIIMTTISHYIKMKQDKFPLFMCSFQIKINFEPSHEHQIATWQVWTAVSETIHKSPAQKLSKKFYQLAGNGVLLLESALSIIMHPL